MCRGVLQYAPTLRKLDRQSRELYLFEKLAKLELTRKEWNELKDSVQRSAYSVQKSFSGHYDFYLNAEKRDEALLKNFLLTADR